MNPELSVVKIIEHFKKISEDTALPLPPELLVIQEDAYKRLGGAERVAETPYLDSIATIDYMSKQKDEDLRFGIDFFEQFCGVTIEYVGTILFQYADIAKSEAEVASQLVALLHMLSNGQISCILTSRNGRICASELIIQQSSDEHMVLGTSGDYPWWWRNKKDDSGYVYTWQRNKLSQKEVAIPDNFMLFHRDANGKILETGRIFKNREFSPLTKHGYRGVLNKALWAGTNKKENQSDWSYLYKSWEFWLLMLAFGGVMLSLQTADLLPSWLVEYPMVFWPLLLYVTYRFLVPTIKRKHELGVSSPDHPYVVVDRFLQQKGLASVGTLLYAGLFTLSFTPIFIPSGTKSAFPITEYGQDHPAVYGLLAALALAATLGFTKSRWLHFLGALIGIACAVAYTYYNGGVTMDESPTPEPWNSLLALTVVSILIIDSIRAVAAIRRKR